MTLGREFASIFGGGVAPLICAGLNSARVPNRHKYPRVHDDYGSFVGTVTLPAGANEDDITATYDKGIFTLSVGVSEAAPAQKHVTVRATN